MAKNFSRKLSYLLRHNSEGLDMDGTGWVDTKKLLEKTDIQLGTLIKIVKENDKQRFEFNDDKSKIRASQGHSIDIDLVLPETEPPDALFHGTAQHNLIDIYNNGLSKMNRNHVHLSKDISTAIEVGKRHSKSYAVLEIDCKAMYADGFKFYLSKNGVWLTIQVPTKYISAL